MNYSAAFSFRVATRTYESEAVMRRVVVDLVYHSAWFMVTPMPDDEWEVAVKEEAAPILDRVAKQCAKCAEEEA